MEETGACQLIEHEVTALIECLLEVASPSVHDWNDVKLGTCLERAVALEGLNEQIPQDVWEKLLLIGPSDQAKEDLRSLTTGQSLRTLVLKTMLQNVHLPHELWSLVANEYFCDSSALCETMAGSAALCATVDVLAESARHLSRAKTSSQGGTSAVGWREYRSRPDVLAKCSIARFALRAHSLDRQLCHISSKLGSSPTSLSAETVDDLEVIALACLFHCAAEGHTPLQPILDVLLDRSGSNPGPGSARLLWHLPRSLVVQLAARYDIVWGVYLSSLIGGDVSGRDQAECRMRVCELALAAPKTEALVKMAGAGTPHHSLIR